MHNAWNGAGAWPAEAGAAWHPSPAWVIGASYTYMKGNDTLDNAHAHQLLAAVQYWLSKRTMVYVAGVQQRADQRRDGRERRVERRAAVGCADRVQYAVLKRRRLGQKHPPGSRRAGLMLALCHQKRMVTDFGSVYASMNDEPYSRPIPEPFAPPNGTAGSTSVCMFTHTVPASIRGT